MALAFAFSTVVYAEDPAAAEEAQAYASLESEDGLLEFIDYVVKDDVLAVVVSYTNTTDENVTPSWQVSVNAFQEGIEMEPAGSWEIDWEMEGIRDGNSEIRPGTKIYMAEYFRMESQQPVEVELDTLDLFDKQEPVYVTINFETEEITVKGGETVKKRENPLTSIIESAASKVYEEAADAYKEAYDEAMNEYQEAYDEAMNEYQDAYDAAMEEYSDMMSGLGF